MLGPDQPIILHLLDTKDREIYTQGVMYELEDCAFPLLEEVIVTSNLAIACKDTDYNFCVGGLPRTPEMSRNEFVERNASIFADFGKAIDENSKVTAKTLIVADPSNTNTLVCQHFAPHIPMANFTALTRLAQNRAVAQIARESNCNISDVK